MERFVTPIGLKVFATAVILGLSVETCPEEVQAEGSGDLLSQHRDHRHKVVIESHCDGSKT